MPPYHWGEFQIHAFHVPPSMGLHRVSHEFTELTKLALEKQPVIQSSLVMALHV